ncbi:cupin domain-containing protein [Roseinatronobacter monicus]|uniref:cupin domain-containing protein n=1 Tax=Roseinatronobacter monicus TaxID=393481 RepID=UPI003F3556D9
MLHLILKPGLAVMLALGLVGPAIADSAHHEVVTSDQIEWDDGPDFIEAGAQLAVLAGDPGAGPFTVRLRLPEGFDIHSHTHTDPKYLTVVEGAMHIGFGPELDKSEGERVEAGSFVKVPAGHMHYEWFEEETVLQVQMNAPITVDYVDPDRDPRN